MLIVIARKIQVDSEQNPCYSRDRVLFSQTKVTKKSSTKENLLQNFEKCLNLFFSFRLLSWWYSQLLNEELHQQGIIFF